MTRGADDRGGRAIRGQGLRSWRWMMAPLLGLAMLTGCESTPERRCAAGESRCVDRCVDVARDVVHCGGCHRFSGALGLTHFAARG